MQEVKKILIVEDEASIAMDLSGILEEAGYSICDIAYSYDQAVNLLADEKPNLVLLDIALKGRETGLDVARVIKEKYRIPYIFLTSFSDKATVDEAITLNPSGYLVKPFKEKDIVPAVLLAMSQKPLANHKSIPELNYLNSKIAGNLSPQEYKVLALLCDGNTNKEIAAALFVSLNTVKTHLYKLYQKLDTNSRSSTVGKVMSL